MVQTIQTASLLFVWGFEASRGDGMSAVGLKQNSCLPNLSKFLFVKVFFVSLFFPKAFVDFQISSMLTSIWLKKKSKELTFPV